MTEQNVHISYDVSKLGGRIPTVSVPAGCTCRPDAPCFKLCYARKGHFRFGNVKANLEDNLRTWHDDPQMFEKEVREAAVFAHWFRWHSSGDIVDDAYFRMMVRVAVATPSTKFLAFTKKFEIVNRYLDEGGVIPDNLTVVFSVWGSWKPENPHNLPMAYVQLKDGDCDIPADAFECSGYCGKCVMYELNCWKLKRGQSVVFRQH